MAVQRTSKRAKQKAAPVRSADDVMAHLIATGLVDGVYLLPSAAIHGPGDYVTIAEALRKLAEPGFPLTDLVDAVDVAGDQASLELKLDGVYHVLDAVVDGAKVDEGVLVMLGALFEQRQPAEPAAARRWLLVDAETCKAKTYLVICAKLAAMRALNEAAGMRFVKLSEL